MNIDGENTLACTKEMGEGKAPLDWGMAENLAYATLVESGNIATRPEKTRFWSRRSR